MLKLKSSLRENIGTNENRRLRKAGLVPAIVYGKGKESQIVKLKQSDLIHAQNSGALFHSVLLLNIDGKREKVIVKDLQRHPYKPLIQHIDFMYINSKDKIVLSINIETKGNTDISKKGLIISNPISSVEVSCLPEDIPESIVVDVASMEAGDKVVLGDITPPSGVSFTAIESDEDAVDWTVLSIGYPDTNEIEDNPETEDISEAEGKKE